MLNIKGLFLGNFRVFPETSSFRLAPVTILTGPNNSGKSTITGSLSLLRNLDTSILPFRLRLDNNKNPFGNFDAIAGKRSRDKFITAGYDLYNIILGENVRVTFTFERGRNFEALVRNINIRSNKGSLFDFSFGQNRMQTKIGLNLLYDKLKEIKQEKDHYTDIENNFRQIKSSSGTYKDLPSGDEESQLRIFRVDNDLKRKNLNEYLRNKKISTEGYERLFYFFGRHRSFPGNTGVETELTKKAGRIVADYNEGQVLCNNDLLNRILQIPVEQLDVPVLKTMIGREFPELFDCMMLLNVPESLENIVNLLKSREYNDWEEEFLSIKHVSIRRLKCVESIAELSSAIDHHFQTRFERSAFFRAVTDLSMTREGFSQSYHRNKNIRALTSFCSLITEKIIHDLKTDLERAVPLHPASIKPVTPVDINHPMHELIRNYPYVRGKDVFLKKWFRKFRIGEDFSADPMLQGIGYAPGFMRNDEKNPLASEGSGSVRLLMMLLGIVNARNYCDLRDYNEEVKHYPGTIVLEQPEAGLHPSIQLKLPDLFADAGKEFGLHFLIETHSEYIINKIQYLVATGVLKNEDVLIYHLDSRNGKRTPSVIEITMDENGNLSQEIPGAFFDEEDRRAMGLFKLRRVSRN